MKKKQIVLIFFVLFLVNISLSLAYRNIPEPTARYDCPIIEKNNQTLTSYGVTNTSGNCIYNDPSRLLGDNFAKFNHSINISGSAGVVRRFWNGTVSNGSTSIENQLGLRGTTNSSNFTVACWTFLEPTTRAGGYLWEFRNTTSGTRISLVTNNGNDLDIDSGGAGEIVNITNSKWLNILGTYSIENRTCSYYIEGKYNATTKSGSGGCSLTGSANEINFANIIRAIDIGQQFNGRLAKCEIWNGVYANDTFAQVVNESWDDDFVVASDTTAPTYTNNLTNFTSLNNSFPAGMNVTWTDDTALSHCIPSVDDGVGSFTNLSVVPLTGTTGTCNITRTVLGFPHTLFRWLFYANDTAKNMNGTTIMQTNISDVQAPTYSANFSNVSQLFANTSFMVNATFSDNTSLQMCVPSLDNGSGTFVNQTPVLLSGTTGVCNLTILQSTAQASQIVRWRFHVNDTSKNMNETSISQINVSNTAPIIQSLTPSDGYNDRTNLSILINVTDIDINQNLTIHLWINGTINITQNVTNGVITNITATKMSTNGNYTWYVNVSDGMTNTSSVQRSFILDTSNPTIFRSFTNISLSPRLTNLTLNESCQDDNLFSFEINFTNSSNNYLFNITEVINTTETRFNFTNVINISNFGDWILNARYQCSDDHTSPENLDKYNNTKNKDLAEIEFSTPDNGDKINLKVKSASHNLTLRNLSVTRHTNSWGFGFNFSNGTNEDGTIYTYIFKINNNHELIHRPFSKYPAHFVTKANFIDFRLRDAVANYSVKQTNDKKFEITITTNKTDLIFESVGGLNIVEQNSTIIIDGTIPIINFSGITSDNNTFVNRSWIFINVSITETNLKNMTFWLIYASNKTVHNQTSFFTLTNTLNFSNIPDASWNYNVSIYDNASNYNATELRNITVDTIVPIISLESPANNTEDESGDIIFKYNVTDASGITNCSLLLNNIVNSTNISITKSINQNFTLVGIPEGSYNWSVQCYDDSSNVGATSRFVSILIPPAQSTGSSGSTGGIPQQSTSTTTALKPPSDCKWGITKYDDNIILIKDSRNPKRADLQIDNKGQNTTISASCKGSFCTNIKLDNQTFSLNSPTTSTLQVFTPEAAQYNDIYSFTLDLNDGDGCSTSKELRAFVPYYGAVTKTKELEVGRYNIPIPMAIPSGLAGIVAFILIYLPMRKADIVLGSFLGIFFGSLAMITVFGVLLMVL